MRKLKSKGSLTFLSAAIVIIAAVIIAGCWVKNITIPYYTQTTNYYCGAASAQMILKCPKINKYVNQTTLYNYIHSHNQCSGWASGPKGLKDVLNKYYPAGHFIHYTPTSQDLGIKKLAYTIDKYSVPPAALIYHCMHWVVVRGVITDKQPTTTPTYTIHGFYVNDPWYGSNSLGENKYIAINSWKNDYFTGCNWCGAAGTNYISIVDPAPPPRVNLRFPRVKRRQAKLISVKEVVSSTKKYLASFKKQKGFHKHFPQASRTLGKVKVGIPILVRRSDRRSDGYFIVPLQTGKLTAGAMLINAYSGELKEVTFVKRAINYVSRLQTKTANRMFMKAAPTIKLKPLTTTQRRTTVKSTQTTRKTQVASIKLVKPRISRIERVWEPSAQSQNPYYPLFHIKGTAKGISKVRSMGYMDVKGKVFQTIKKVRMKGGGSGEK